MLRAKFLIPGTAASGRAFATKFPVAGKTGTTNDFTDAWFLINPTLTAGVYVGFDDHRTLGTKEEGAKVALPIWLNFMEQVMKDKPGEDFPHSPLLKTPDQVKEILASGESIPSVPPSARPAVAPAGSKLHAADSDTGRNSRGPENRNRYAEDSAPPVSGPVAGNLGYGLARHLLISEMKIS